MADKSIKKVQVTESKLVNLIDSIVEKTIAERIEKGELIKVPKTKKVTVTESQLRALQAKGAKINSIKKIK